MALRGRIPDRQASYGDPIFGVNLRDAEQDLKRGEARLMQNCVYDGGIRNRLGSLRLNASTLGAFKILGGHKFYYGGSTPVSKRLIAFNNRISVLSDAGSETNLTTTMTANKDTHFLTWSITDKAYWVNGTDELREYDGTTYQLVSAIVGSTAVPGQGANPPARHIAPILDRLMCITTNGIERTSPRVAHVWSVNSSWATLRPSRVGLFTALAPFTVRGTDTLYPGLIAFQNSAYYVITGTDFGDNASSLTASSGEDAAIQLLDPSVGTASPYSVCTVPGIGLFWFTADLNVYWLPEGQLKGRYVGDKLRSTVSTSGIEGTNTAQLGQVWMAYHYPYLMLGIPTGSNAYASTQFWLDIRSMIEHPDRDLVWYGPMTGQTVGRVWLENQNGENAIYGGEGNSASGAFAYRLRSTARYTDAVGTADNNISMVYQTPFEDAGFPSREKYVRGVHLDLSYTTGTPTLSLYDLDGAVDSNVSIEAL